MNSLALRYFSFSILTRHTCWQWATVLTFICLRAVGMPWGIVFELVYGGMLRKTLGEVVGKYGGLHDRVLDELRRKIWAEAGFVPTEGKTMLGDIVFKRVLTDRDADLNLNLFTNVSPTSAITAATLTRPTGTGYAAISLTDASWTNTSGSMTYAAQTFTAGTGGWTGSVQGYDVTTNAASGTPRILGIEVDAAGPYTFAAGDTYQIDLASAF